MFRSITVTALVAVLTVSAGCDWLMSDQDRFDKAQELIEQGRFGDASIQLKKLLQSTDEMPQARALLGRALLETGRAEEAESQLRKAREAGVSPDEYAVALATAYLLQAKHDRILEEFEASALSGNEAIARMHVVRGKAFLAKERFDRAAEAFNAALEAAPGDPGARVGMALLDSAQQRPEKAEARIDRLLEDTPDFPDALLIKGQLALSAGRNQQAAEAFERVGTQERHRVAPLTELQAMAGRVEALYGQGDLEGAGDTVAALSERFPGHPLAAYMQGLIDYANENHEAVISGLTPLVRGGEAMPGAYFLTGASHYALGNLEQAQVFLSRAAEQAPGNTDARRLLAMTEMRLGQPERAGEVVQSMGADAGDMWRMLGGLSLRQGDVDTGLGYLERGADSGDPAAAMDLAAAYIAGGRSGSGLDVLSRLPDTTGDSRRRDMLRVLAHVNDGDFDAARARVDELVEARPDDFSVRSLAGSVYMAAGDPAQARRHYERAHAIEPDNPAGPTNLARLELAGGEAAAAEKRLAALLADAPGYEPAALLLAQLRMRSDDSQGAAETLEAALEASPDSDRLRATLARLYLVQNRPDKVEALAQAALERRPHRDFYVRTLVEARLRQNKLDQAESFLEKQIKAQPESAQPLLYMARVKSSTGQYDSARRYLKQAAALPGGGERARFEMARIDAAAGEYERAREAVAELQEKHPEAAALHELEGDIHAAQGRFERAQAAFARAADLEPSRQLIARLLQAQRKAGMAPDIDRLARWVEAHPGDVDALIMLAQHRQESAGDKSAVPLYEKVLELQPDQVIALNNLAWIYAEQGDERALKLAERAYELAPEQGGIVDTYGWVLMQFDKPEAAVEPLRRAAELEPEVADIRYHLAAALHAAGKGGEARGILADLLESDQPFSERRAAEALYRELR